MERTKYYFAMASTNFLKAFKKLFCGVVISILLLNQSFAGQDLEKDLEQLTILVEKEDYQVGYFYSKKILESKSIESESILKKAEVNAYALYFSDHLSKTDEASKLLIKIREMTTPPEVLEKSTDHIASFAWILSKVYFKRGAYVSADSLYHRIAQYKQQLIPYDRAVIDYIYLSTRCFQGYTAGVEKEIQYKISQLTKTLISDTLILSKRPVKLSPNQIIKRENLIATYYILLSEILYKRGWEKECMEYTSQAIIQCNKILGVREGYKARLLWIKARLLFNSRDLKKSESIYKNALSTSLQFYLAHSTVIYKIQSELIKVLLQQNKNEEAAYYTNDCRVKIYSYYNKTNIGYLPIHLMDIRNAIQTGDYKKGVSQIQECLKTTDMPIFHQYRMDLYKELLVCYQFLNDSIAFIQTLDQLKKQYAALMGENSLEFQQYNIIEANYRRDVYNQFDVAAILYKRVLDMYLLAEPRTLTISCIQAIGEYTKTLFLLEQYSEAQRYLNQTFSWDKNSLEASFKIKIQCLKSICYSETGNYSEANVVLDSITLDIAHLNDISYSIRLEFIYQSLNIALLSGNIEGAKKCLSDLSQLSVNAQCQFTQDVLNSIEVAIYYCLMGRYQLSNKILTSQLSSVQKEFGKHSYKSIILWNALVELNTLTSAYTHADNYVIQTIQQSENIFGGQSYHYAQTLLSVKPYYSEIGDYEKAEYLMNRAVLIYNNLSNAKTTKQGILYHQWARALFEADIYTGRKKQHKNENLESLFQESLTILKATSSDHSILYGEALIDYAIFIAQIQQYDQAIQLLDQAKNLFAQTTGKETNTYAYLDFLTGKIKLQNKQYSDALIHFESAKNNYKTIFGDTYPAYVTILGYESRVYYILKNYSKSVELSKQNITKSLNYINTIFPYLSERGKANYWDKNKDNFEFFKTLAFTLSKENPELIENMLDIQLQTKSILLNAQLKVKNKIYAQGDSVTIGLYEQWQAAKDELALAYSYTESQRKESGYDLVKMEDRLELIEKKLSMLSDAFSKNNTRKEQSQYQWKRLKESLLPGELAIEVIPFRYYSTTFTDSIIYAFVSVKNTSTAPNYIFNTNGKVLEKKYLKNYINCTKFEKLDKLSYGAYWEPIATLIDKDITKILFITDGVYNQINIETLKKPEGEYLIMQYKIHLLGTSRDIINRNIKVNLTIDKTIDLIGNPTYYSTTDVDNRTIPPLPGAEIEVRTIGNLAVKYNWNTSIIIGDAATEDTVKKIINPGILHISTHGFFIDISQETTDIIEGKATINPLLTSGLIFYNGGERMVGMKINEFNLGDGVLTSYEAMNLNLDKTELVVLSACETGLGELKVGEGVFGLQRALAIAGAKCIVMSLSKVSDEVTTKLMELFYQHLLTGMDKTDAFVQAKKDLMKLYPNPKYWGTFIMVGI